ncbi:MAG TPA: HEAT repeat domain-containing protein [Bryobacteraceae bacterium]|nr:HEAT repeat domain-containing protein [Bryobacteraceae bacterium]
MADDQKFLADIQSDSADTRFAAWRQAGEASPAVIPQLGKLAAGQTGVGKASREALTTMVHSVGKDPASANRAGVVRGLIAISGPDYPLPVRVHALRLLSDIAAEDSVPPIAKWIGAAELREEVVYCLERIPGEASNKALMAAYKDAPDDFKPRILAALGHRRAPGAVGLCLEAMRSPNKDIAVMGARAFGRIGKKPATAPRYPDIKGLSDTQATDVMDGMLRYADAQVKEGNMAEAMAVYKGALERPQEHWQCAAVIGLARIGSADAAAAILSKLKSDNRTVRITAENAWKSMAGTKA